MPMHTVKELAFLNPELVVVVLLASQGGCIENKLLCRWPSIKEFSAVLSRTLSQGPTMYPEGANTAVCTIRVCHFPARSTHVNVSVRDRCCIAYLDNDE